MDIEKLSRYDIFIRALPLLTGYLIFLGVIKSLIFFLIFDVYLLEYITLTEAVFISVDGLVLSLLACAFGMLLGMYFWPKTEISSETTIEALNSIIDVGAKHLRKVYFITYLLGILSFIYFLVNAIVKNTPLEWAVFGLAVCIDLFAFIIIQYMKPRKNRNFQNPQNKVLVGLLLFISLSSVYMSTANAFTIKYDKIKMNAIITMKDKSILATSDSLVYVAKVEKFTFLYNKKTMGPEIISNDEIVSVKFSKNNK